MSNAKRVVIAYRNWRNEEADHDILPKRFFYGKNPYHKEYQWLMQAWNYEKQADRTYALSSIVAWKPHKKEEAKA